jgi:CII-binding regulator of phage lambda lysogenization HflD
LLNSKQCLRIKFEYLIDLLFFSLEKVTAIDQYATSVVALQVKQKKSIKMFYIIGEKIRM